MNQNITQITLLVDDYDKAIHFYVNVLNFNLIEDTLLDEGKRWVKISPKGESHFCLLIAKATNDKQINSIGTQSGGRVFLFLNTDNLARDYENLISQKVKIIKEPSIQAYGTVLVFEDLYGNLWDLIEPIKENEDFFYSTAILKVKEAKHIEKTKTALSILQIHTKKEIGNIMFDIHLSKDNDSEFVIWECFKNEHTFNEHLNSEHFKIFLKLDLVNFENAYKTYKI